MSPLPTSPRVPSSSWRRLARAAGLLGMIGAAAPSPAASRDHAADVWRSEDGLPANSATAIAQTPDGYLWLGTYNGLVRFDGLRFVTFDPLNTPALKRARVDRLFVDETGTLWVNTHDGSLTTWRAGEFTTEWEGPTKIGSGVWLASIRAEEQVFLLETGGAIRREIREGRAGAWQTIRPPGSAFTRRAAVAGSGELWVVGQDGRLWRIAGGRCQEVATGALGGRVIRCLATDPAGRLWLGTDREIALWNGAGFERRMPAGGEPVTDVNFLAFTRDGGFWAAANGRFRRALGDRWVVEAGRAARGFTDVAPWTLNSIEDDDGTLWLAHDGQGLLRLRRDGAAEALGTDSGLANPRVKCLAKDREGDVWLSVDRGGLVRFRKRKFHVVDLGDPSPAPAPAAVSVAEDGDGSLWIGTLGRGLVRWRREVPTHVELGPPATRPAVFSIFPGGAGRLWLSADAEDLWWYERGELRKAPWPVHGIKVILADRAGRVWLGRKDGLSVLAGGELRRFGAADGFDEVDVRALAEDRDGAIWVGCGDGTVYRARGSRFERFRPTDAASVHPVWALLADADGTIWVGTHGGGLLRLQQGRFSRFTTRHGLGSDFVCQLVADDLGALWIGSRDGITRVPRASFAGAAAGASLPGMASYGRSDGLPPLECSGYQPSSWKARDGRIWFATTRGAAFVRPDRLEESRLVPPVVIEEVRVDHALQDLRAAALPPGRLVVPAGRRHVEVRYAGLSLRSPETVRFRYRLEGLESEWVEAGAQRVSQYSYLRPGDYRFRVIACNSDGVWNERGASLALRVLPHFWETWWFSAVLGLSAVAVVAGTARQIVTRRLRREMERLERQRAVEHDRARIARDIHDDLGAGLTRISLLSELAREDGPQEAARHLEQIAATSDELTRAMDEIVWAVNPSHDTMEGLWSYLTHIAQDDLGVAGIQCRLDAPQPLPATPVSSEVRHNVFLAVREAINNVVKHAGARVVWLKLTLRPGAFTLLVQDDGGGGDQAAGPAPGPARASSGYGLGNMAQRMLDVGGTCRVHRDASGTRVELTVSMPAQGGGEP